MTKEFDAKNAAKSRRVCADMAEAASTGKRVLTEHERQILDMWPRFEDGEYVWFGDAYIDEKGDANKVRDVRFDDRYACLVGVEGFLTVFNIGEHAKRPVQSVLDADGVEIKVGDTVYDSDGDNGTVTAVHPASNCVDLWQNNCDLYEVDPLCLTHVQPDSWERFIEDMQKSSCAYFGYRHKECDEGDGCPARGALDCSNRKMADLIRRAKALARVEVAE